VEENNHLMALLFFDPSIIDAGVDKRNANSQRAHRNNIDKKLDENGSKYDKRCLVKKSS